MRVAGFSFISVLLLSCVGVAAPKPHVVSFGSPTSVRWLIGPAETEIADLKIRPLYVDGRLKESTTGTAHEITDRQFVVQRAYRLNDSLPGEAPHWIWQRGAWLLVDRVTGRISPINLPDFDAYYSAASWYRDYVAYCGVSDGGRKVYAVVAQLGRRKPVLKSLVRDGIGGDKPDSACAAPGWQRHPARVSFAADAQTQTYEIKGHAADLIDDVNEDERATE